VSGARSVAAWARCERKVVIILIVIIDSRIVDDDWWRLRRRRRRGSTAMGSGSMHTDTTRSRPQVAARTGLIVRTRGRPVAMLGVDDGCGGTSTTHSDIELVVFVVVNAHLGEASRSLDFAQGYESSEAELLGIKAVHSHCCRA
jgi:hypothetical protein